MVQKLPCLSGNCKLQEAAAILHSMVLVCAGAVITTAGVKAGSCNCNSPSSTFVTIRGSFHLSLMLVASLKLKLLIKGRPFCGVKLPALFNASQRAMAPEKRLCMVLFLVNGDTCCILLRNTRPAEAAIPKFALRIFVAGDWCTIIGTVLAIEVSDRW